MTRKKDTWYLRAGPVPFPMPVGQQYKSLTQALGTGRYYACAVLEELRVRTEVDGREWEPCVVEIVHVVNGDHRNEEVLSSDYIPPSASPKFEKTEVLKERQRRKEQASG